MKCILYTVAVGGEWRHRAEALIRSARDAGYAGDVFVQYKPVRKPWSLQRFAPNYLRFIIELPGGSKSYDRIIYADADCIIQRNPSKLAGEGENKFAADPELFSAPHPCVKQFIRLMSAETIERHQNDHIVNSGFFSVTGEAYALMCAAVRAIMPPELDDPQDDQTLLNKVLWEDPPFEWSTFAPGVVAYGPIEETKYPEAAVMHYIGANHEPLDKRIVALYPDIVNRMEARMA